MGHDDKDRDPLPDKTASLEEVADFWASHDTTEYADAFMDANVTFDIRQRHYQIDVPKDTFELLERRAASLNMPVQKIIDEALRKELVSAP